MAVQDGLQAIARGHVRLLACEPQDAHGEITEALFGTVAAKYSTVGMVGIVRRSQVEGSALVRLVRAGAHALLMADDRLTTLDCRRVLTEAIVRSGVCAPGMGLLAASPPGVRPLLEYGLRYAHESTTVANAARALNVHRKTLFWWCVEAGVPAPQQILGWCRLLAAAALLDDEGRRVDHIALDLDFPSGTALRNLLQRYVGLSPAKLRTLGASRHIHHLFRRALNSVVAI
ncbi:MAG: helix-turn-helix domain-containing protein [Gemmatimonadetes bacterium]|nr:helix-turn-helix domain-containing protein [Gemmatimonadota bacterium]